MTNPNEVPQEAQAQIRSAVDTALAKPSQAQGFLDKIPDLSAAGGVKDKVTEVIDGVLGALNTVMQYAWIVPDQYEEPIKKLISALEKVKGWLD
jgi:hypothetical protein